jgi:hypothetical protein
MYELNTNNKDFRKWVRKFYKKKPETLKPEELLNKFIIYKAWKNAPTTEQKNINNTIRI